MNGRLEFPLARSLNWADWSLMLSLAAAVVLWFVPAWSRSARAVAFVAFAAVVTVVAVLVVPERNLSRYDQYRAAVRQGRATFVLNPPVRFSPSDRLFDERQVEDRPPAAPHYFGTDIYGGDVLSRILHACRIAMSIGLISTGISIAIGIVIGGLMGYFAGVVDLLGMRLIEIFEAIPTLFLMITLVAFFPGESYRLYMIMVVIGVTGWTGNARFLRAEVLRLRDQDFVHAAIAAGLPLRSIVFRHILPNGITPIVVTASFAVAGAIISEATLSFLHLGVIDQPDWGAMLNQSLSEAGTFYWWLAVFPGAAIFLTVLAYNQLGQALTDALDPKRT